jgi:bifunctional non-homologous end joining protein LigD
LLRYKLDRSQIKMPKTPYAPCIPTRSTKVPDHPDWIHEVKQDGFRLIVQRDHERVRLFTRNGYDWTTRYRRDNTRSR